MKKTTLFAALLAGFTLASCSKPVEPSTKPGTDDNTTEPSVKPSESVKPDVDAVLPTSVKLNCGEHVNLINGKTIQLTATVAPDDATNKDVIWESSDTTVATVVDGLVTTLGLGKAEITVKCAADETVVAKTTVHSCNIPTGISFEIDKKPVTELTLKEGATKKPYIKYEGDNPFFGGKWSTDNEEVCKPTSWGGIEAVKAGTCTLTFTSDADENVKGTLKITVEALPKAAPGTFNFNDLALGNITEETKMINGKDTVIITEFNLAYVDKSNVGKDRTAIKLGDKGDTNVGKIVLTLPEGYTKVEVHAAAWSAGKGTLKINGEAQTLTTDKSKEVWDKFELAYPADKTLTIEGTTRVVVDKIVLVK